MKPKKKIEERIEEILDQYDSAVATGKPSDVADQLKSLFEEIMTDCVGEDEGGDSQMDIPMADLIFHRNQLRKEIRQRAKERGIDA